jgi:hydrogenase maturation protein HypF
VARGTGPVTTSMGRLFDAAAALLGIRSRVTYEAQAAIELEALARQVPRAEAPRYPGTVVVSDAGGAAQVDPAPLVARMRAERDQGTALPVVAAGFHEAIGRAVAEVAVEVARQRSLDSVVLTGGVFQNARLSEVVAGELEAAGLRILLHANVPCGDGGISVGQAAIAALAP